ncbi:hypothetical protein N7537_006871 [Penicillium hordei]|uniref:gamma-glutamylcyclotransferase n=1 Tax=Penicillium hordei TaxID=40994 RepID=A0AAD6E8D2_9EURO|nr:uncharacterized protein N7537_006871 [Penicillium hordei]KAJ5603915.1 hypothetical protein N7537_006871 [Penicillium hordei]
MADMVWYFGYGSNMKSSVMINRGITPLSIKVGVVPTHFLTFDIFGIPYTEPSFASIALLPSKSETDEVAKVYTLSTTDTSPIPPVHGVLYQLRREDYLRLVLSEGSGVGYDEITVEAYILKTQSDGTKRTKEQPIMAQTLKAKYPRRPNSGPSRRYMGLILEGCKEHNIPVSYQKYLESLPVYGADSVKKSWFQTMGALLFLFFWRRVIQVLARTTKIVVDDSGHCPPWLGQVIVMVYHFMWFWHDHVHSRIWGMGHGDLINYGGRAVW